MFNGLWEKPSVDMVIYVQLGSGFPVVPSHKSNTVFNPLEFYVLWDKTNEDDPHLSLSNTDNEEKQVLNRSRYSQPNHKLWI